MVQTQRSRLGNVAALAIVASLLGATSARAIYLDEEQNVTLRAQIYSQGSIRIQNSAVGTTPTTFSGQLVQNRNFFSPELDAKLTEYFNFLQGSALDWLKPDDLRFRVAGWAFYDGIYDYGSAQFNESQRLVNQTFGQLTGVCSAGPQAGQSCSSAADCSGAPCKPAGGGWFIQGSRIAVPNPPPDNVNQIAMLDTFRQAFPQNQEKVPRDTYANQERVNELYLSYSKGPFFLRVGRQAISWGESDTIALLDQTNPFDVTVAAPGIFEDIDESRIPLWTVRSSYNLFETLGPLSSGFVEGYIVPGPVDTNVGFAPILTASPYSPRGQDPQKNGGPPINLFPINYQFVFFDHLPKNTWANSRFGVRFQTVVNRFLTTQAWYYSTFSQSPVPVKVRAFELPIPDSSGVRPFFPVSLEHKQVNVWGLAGTFFAEPLDSIVRIEAEMFNHEAGFIPERNLNIRRTPSNPSNLCLNVPLDQQTTLCPSDVNGKGSIPYANILRWETGFDRFFFFRPLNPTNSFVFVLSGVGSYNLDETASKDFRMNGQTKPGPIQVGPGQYIHTGAFVNDYVQAKVVEFFTQMTIQTDYMHGRLSPRFTWVQNKRGTYLLNPAVIYRWSDWLLFTLNIVHIGGAYQSFGFFKDRDQVSLRATYQLN